MSIESWLGGSWSGLFGGNTGAAGQDIGFGPGNVAPDYAGMSLPSGASLDTSKTKFGGQDIGFGAGNVAPDYAGFGGTTAGLNWDKVGGALTDLAKGGLGKSGASGGAGPAQPGLSMGGGQGAQMHRGGGSSGLDAVVKALVQRQLQYQQAATPQTGTVVDPKRVRGILGI